MGDFLSRSYRFCFGLFGTALILFLSACSTSPDVERVALESVLASSHATALDYETSSGGLIVFELDLQETGPGAFILDTGATTSVIYRHSILPGTEVEIGGDVRVHDMNFLANRPTARVEGFFIGQKEIEDINFAILDQPNYSDPLLRETKGVIGLDILTAYKVMIDPLEKKLYFIDAQSSTLKFDKNWSSIRLNERPFNKEVLGLHFLDLVVNGTEAFALLDTGSEFNVMNWNFQRLRKLRVKRQHLRKNWKVNGAIGEFRPEWSVFLEGIEFGRHGWPHQLFSVHRLDLFDTMDLEGKPIMIVGMPFFEGKTILIDFANDSMWIKTGSLRAKKSASTTSEIAGSTFQ